MERQGPAPALTSENFQYKRPDGVVFRSDRKKSVIAGEILGRDLGIYLIAFVIEVGRLKENLDF